MRSDDGCARPHRNPRRFRLSKQGLGERGPQIQHRHPRADGCEFASRGVDAVIAGAQHHALAAQHAVAVEVAAQGRGQHHAGQIVVAKHQRPLDRPGRQHGIAGTHQPVALPGLAFRRGGEVIGDPFDQAVDFTIIGPEGGGAREDAQIGQLVEFIAHRLQPRIPCPARWLVEQRTAERVVLIDQDDPRPAAPRRQRRRQTGRTRADHQRVAEGIHLLVAIWIIQHRRLRCGGGFADEMLEKHPRLGATAGADEGLVVKPRWHKAHEQAQQPANIAPHRGPTALAVRH